MVYLKSVEVCSWYREGGEGGSCSEVNSQNYSTYSTNYSIIQVREHPILMAHCERNFQSNHASGVNGKKVKIIKICSNSRGGGTVIWASILSMSTHMYSTCSRPQFSEIWHLAFGQPCHKIIKGYFLFKKKHFLLKKKKMWYWETINFILSEIW